MRKILYFLAEITDQDLDWISGAGTREVLSEGQILVEQGNSIDNLSIVLRGRFSVAVNGKLIADVNSGEVVGELSFLDSRPPSATVKAVETSVVWQIPVGRIKKKLQSDLGFASRFYRFLGVLLAHRMRQNTVKLAFGESDEKSFDDEDPMEVDPEYLDRLTLAGLRFDRLQSELLSR
ncbi:MAG: cyclic nucleotide-binding domain-containing protein [Rubripirellula sp.]